VRGGARTIVYHSLFNNARVLDGTVLSLLEFCATARSRDEIARAFTGEADAVVASLVGLGFLCAEGADERRELAVRQRPFLDRVQSGANLSRLELAISDACNLGCEHCMHFNNNEISVRTSRTLHMSAEVARASIDTFVAQVRRAGNRDVRIQFGNGEPLLNWHTLRDALEYSSSLAGLSFSYAINTNLTILTREMAETLKRYGVRIATSLDGLRDANDSIRVDRRGKGTFDRIVGKIRLLQEIGHPIEGFTITATGRNFHALDVEVIDFAQSIGVKDIAFDCDLVDTTGIPVEEMVEKVLSFREHARALGMNFYGTWETPYRAVLHESWRERGHAFCPAMEGRTLSFGVDGSIRTCGHTNTKVGSLSGFVQLQRSPGPFVDLIRSRLPGNSTHCAGCIIEGSCAGQCHVTLESSRRNPALLDVMCDFMRQTTLGLLRQDISHSAPDPAAA
jgi:uncharacterized protein